MARNSIYIVNAKSKHTTHSETMAGAVSSDSMNVKEENVKRESAITEIETHD